MCSSRSPATRPLRLFFSRSLAVRLGFCFSPSGRRRRVQWMAYMWFWRRRRRVYVSHNEDAAWQNLMEHTTHNMIYQAWCHEPEAFMALNDIVEMLFLCLLRLLMCWWIFLGLTHIILEGCFTFTPGFYKERTHYLRLAISYYISLLFVQRLRMFDHDKNIKL